MADGFIKQIQIGSTLYDLHDARIDNDENGNPGLEKRLQTLENYNINYRNLSFKNAQGGDGGTYSGFAKGKNQDDGGWIRAPKSGILPYTNKYTSFSGVDPNNTSKIGTSSWPFTAVYANKFYGQISADNLTEYASLKTKDISTARSIPDAQWTTFYGSASGEGFVLPADSTWIVSYGVQFASNKNGRRYACLSNEKKNNTNPPALWLRATGTSENAVSSGSTYLNGCFIAQGSATIYTKVYQSSGGALSAYGYIRAFRLN